MYGAPTQFANCPSCPTFVSTAVMGELRFDLVTVAIRTSKHVLIEASTPSFRMLFPAQGPLTFGLANDILYMWVTTVSVNYVF